jgi:hypothetical protein
LDGLPRIRRDGGRDVTGRFKRGQSRRIQIASFLARELHDPISKSACNRPVGRQKGRFFILQAFFAHQARPERGLAAIWRSIRVRRVCARMTISHRIGAMCAQYANRILSGGDRHRASIPHDPPKDRSIAIGTGSLTATPLCFF